MKYQDIRVGQRLKMRGVLQGAYDAEVVQVDPRRITCNDTVQVRVFLASGTDPTLLWVSPFALSQR
jgi:hypothetical protein